MYYLIKYDLDNEDGLDGDIIKGMLMEVRNEENYYVRMYLPLRSDIYSMRMLYKCSRHVHFVLFLLFYILLVTHCRSTKRCPYLWYWLSTCCFIPYKS